MTLSVEQERRRALRQSERTRLHPFVVIGGDASPRDQRDLMERPFFSLSKSPRTKPILYRANDVEVQVFGMPEHGMATIWDADVLIWAASQIVRAENLGLTTSRFFRFTPYQLLRGVGRPTGNRQYLLLKAALARLQSTVIATTIRNGEHWRRRQFSWINEWEEMSTRAGRVEGMEFVLPDLVLRERHRPLAGADHRSRLLPADGRHRALALQGCAQARRPSAAWLGVRVRASPRQVGQSRARLGFRARHQAHSGAPAAARLSPADRAQGRPRTAAHPAG
jgi:plasmid replication initiation protein